jgi:D-mannonate dehydratase
MTTTENSIIEVTTATLNEKLGIYREKISAAEAEIVETRERHETERQELRTRQEAEIAALRGVSGSTSEMIDMHSELTKLRAFLTTVLGVESAEKIEIPAVPGSRPARRAGLPRRLGQSLSNRKGLITEKLTQNPDGLTASAIAMLINPELDKADSATQMAEKNRVQSCLASGLKSGHFVATKDNGGNIWTLAATTATVDADEEV